MFYSKRTQIGTVWYNMILYRKVRKYLYCKSGQLVKAFVGQKLDNVDRAFCPQPPPSPPFSREEVVADIAAVPDTSFPKDWLTKVQCTCHGSWYISIMMMETGGWQDAGLLCIVARFSMPLHLPRIKVRNVTVWINTGGTPARTFHKETFSFSCSFFPQVCQSLMILLLPSPSLSSSSAPSLSSLTPPTIIMCKEYLRQRCRNSVV